MRGYRGGGDYRLDAGDAKGFPVHYDIAVDDLAEVVRRSGLEPDRQHDCAGVNGDGTGDHKARNRVSGRSKAGAHMQNDVNSM